MIILGYCHKSLLEPVRVKRQKIFATSSSFQLVEHPEFQKRM